ncbi:DNA-directed RNA polymerase subunit alpha [Thermoanaerobacterium thermosaccharolyticum]|jgi:DNA-directed RNA polymerase subunit alpha|uniref:DNA-directed RNA polymerase subunit alpha n=3 Tax=Thermoanaerobacterium thermosaccharolyticum TaxID=1517 RepID=D9TSD2_THETC|nr:DNA-directed RNA polymerase, alpha subunit [Thermoanaerobacterium thermosaccharolyticum DSM 571]AGB18139.1 DNA-directed RNA polymerase, alpha subunit [Thermoanaerobacterium thermosaccharolyticum M0795]AST57907.1 DNA-directed RNA polymerase subunit alpha [Thermoanaerobacterium thermosaccharolyticum]TCW42398.1 DNA-directed RNA polymerase subunit alpha [Thermohydrogenium kirishiense]KAA5807061.1 DNA-directed RNA polymerase subunit alpha [Thermoanaerobacterium thermosaccharolyticum]
MVIEIEKPKIEIVEQSNDDTYAKFVIEPLERGYGITLGNSLRRMLLSSLPGAAAKTIKIDGVLHEFSTVPGVKEDVTEIILNLKELAVKLYTDEPKIVRIEAEGKGEVTAGDIISDGDVEIMNPDLHIATLSDNGKLNMEIELVKGKGYVPSDKNKEPNQPIGIIPVDSIFTPVKKVSYNVENTRVGQVTDYDKLTMEVWTNGTISPKEAISLAAKILIDHFNLFTSFAENYNDMEVLVEKSEKKTDKPLDMTIEELDLSVRSYNCLKRAGINTVQDLVQKTEEEMMKVRNLGKKSLVEVEQKLKALGLSLQKSEE